MRVSELRPRLKDGESVYVRVTISPESACVVQATLKVWLTPAPWVWPPAHRRRSLRTVSQARVIGSRCRKALCRVMEVGM